MVAADQELVSTEEFVSRPNWIIYREIKYMNGDYLLIGWQSVDDLPCFGRIRAIVIIKNCLVLFVTDEHITIGIDRHYHSYVIKKSSKVLVCWHFDLVDHQPLQSHALFKQWFSLCNSSLTCRKVVVCYAKLLYLICVTTEISFISKSYHMFESSILFCSILHIMFPKQHTALLKSHDIVEITIVSFV